MPFPVALIMPTPHKETAIGPVLDGSRAPLAAAGMDEAEILGTIAKYKDRLCSSGL